MNRRSFLGIGGSFVAWALIPSLPAGGTEIFVTKPLDGDLLIRGLEWRDTTGYVLGDRRYPYAGIWCTPMLDVKLRPGYEPAWFHREGPFGLYQSCSHKDRMNQARDTLERAIRLLAQRYDEVIRVSPSRSRPTPYTGMEPAMYDYPRANW